MDFRAQDMKTTDPKELWTRCVMFNTGLKGKKQKKLERKANPQGQCLILLVERGSSNAIRVCGYKVYTGVNHGIFKNLLDHKCKAERETRAGKDPKKMSMAVGEGTKTDTPTTEPGKRMREDLYEFHNEIYSN
jgi:hypothetical protein